jgi:hypothetical protein
MLLKSVANFLIRDLLLDKLECARIAGALAADQELFRSKALCGHFQKVPAGLGEWKVIKHINRHSSIEKNTVSNDHGSILHIQTTRAYMIIHEDPDTAFSSIF